MARYENGRIPFDVLVHLGGEHWATAATADKFFAMRADVWEHEGVWLEITPGPNAYRWYEAQEETYENEPPGNAAYPGTSSHGGVFKGVDAMALDIGNWGLLGRDRFYYYARKHGFEPNYFDWEPWHIIDWDPWASVPAGGGSASPIQSEEDDMAVLVTGGGQNLILGNKLIPLNADDVRMLSRSAQVIEVTPGTHYNIIQAFARDEANAALPVLVYVRDGDGTVYLLTDGKLEALVDPTTLAELHSKGAASVTLSKAEVNNLLNA